ncbi:type IVB secretion system protein IcmW [Piscirickettsia salmonis]|uniref:type IVB secretion system protein IcmW n=1 Tax=Piscirickettsia salmonis TaxID=1238 RepID=UPI003752D92A
MIDLAEEVADYWKSYKNSNINHALINFELIEKEIYLINDSDATKVAEVLEYASDQDLSHLSHDLILRLMNSLPAAYMFYLLHQLNKYHSEYVANLIDKSNELKDKQENYKNFYDRNMLFEKLQIVARIFSSDRVNKLIQALSE